jgi:hypothetical protein
MQTLTLETSAPPRLHCGTCVHWQRGIASPPDNEPTGRCGRFSETRVEAARPRCNICWEPSMTPIGDSAIDR